MSLADNSNSSFEDGMDSLIATPEWSLIAGYTGITGGFNFFQLIEDAICENAWSRVLQFLFSSSALHGLGLEPLQKWCGFVYGIVPKWLVGTGVSVAESEWGTFEGRRLDILVKLLDGNGHLQGVLGIENKVWSGEQFEQLGDYQEALIRAFPKVPKVLVFLTPAGQPSFTATASKECPVQPASYSSLVEMCRVLPVSNEGMKLLLDSLRGYISENLLMKHIHEDEIKAAVARLYQNMGHRRTIEQIIRHRPTVRDVLEKAASIIEGAFGRNEFGGTCKVTREFYPKRDAFPIELKIRLEGLKTPRGASIEYLLRCRPIGDKPGIGDKFAVLLNAWCTTEGARMRSRELSASLPTRLSHSTDNWSGWEVLWEGESYQLQDLGAQDVVRLTDNLRAAIDITFEPLCAALLKAGNSMK